MNAPAADPVVVVLANAPDAATAERIAQALVERRLAACVNLGAPMRSIYRWQGAVETADEVPMWIKSTASRQRDLVQALVDLHPYDVPEVLVVPVLAGHAPYLDWVRQETQR